MGCAMWYVILATSLQVNGNLTGGIDSIHNNCPMEIYFQYYSMDGWKFIDNTGENQECNLDIILDI